MASVPVIVLALKATHPLDPFILDYSLVWTEAITANGFRACVHEAVLFSGEHQAKVVRISLFPDKDRFSKYIMKLFLNG